MATVGTPNTALKLAIFAAGRSQIEIATVTGIHPTRLSKIVRGWIAPNKEEALKVARALRLPVSTLFPEAHV